MKHFFRRPGLPAFLVLSDSFRDSGGTGMKIGDLGEYRKDEISMHEFRISKFHAFQIFFFFFLLRNYYERSLRRF